MRKPLSIYGWGLRINTSVIAVDAEYQLAVAVESLQD